MLKFIPRLLVISNTMSLLATQYCLGNKNKKTVHVSTFFFWMIASQQNHVTFSPHVFLTWGWLNLWMQNQWIWRAN